MEVSAAMLAALGQATVPALAYRRFRLADVAAVPAVHFDIPALQLSFRHAGR